MNIIIGGARYRSMISEVYMITVLSPHKKVLIISQVIDMSGVRCQVIASQVIACQVLGVRYHVSSNAQHKQYK